MPFHPPKDYPQQVRGPPIAAHSHGSSQYLSSYSTESYGHDGGKFTAVPDDLAVAVVPVSAQHAYVAQRAEPLPLGMRVVRHIPLGPEDEPGSRNSKKRRFFRDIINWVNELDRLHPDLMTAKQNGWQSHITKLAGRIKHLEEIVALRIKKHAHCALFKEMLPKYPQLWKYLDESFRRRLERAALPSPPIRPRIPRRQIEAPPTLFKDEDTKDPVLESIANYRVSGLSGSSTNKADEHAARQVTQNANFSHVLYENIKAEQIKIEEQDNSDDDCFIVDVRKVVSQPRLDNTTIPAPQSRVPTPTARNQTDTIAMPATPTRSLRSRDIFLPIKRQRLHSSGLRSQFYRDRSSPRRDAVVEELLDSE